jgi:hypothetical protein
MKKTAWCLIAIIVSALSAPATLVFKADFNNSPYGVVASNDAEPLNAGTPVGSWTSAMNTGSILTNITATGDMLLQYSNRGLLTGTFSQTASLAQGVDISFDFRPGSSNAGRSLDFVGLDSLGASVFRLNLSIDTALNNAVTVYTSGGSVVIGQAVKYAQVQDKAWNSVLVNIDGSTLTVSGQSAEGTVWSAVSGGILSSSADLAKITILGSPTTSNVTMLFDNIQVTAIPEPAALGMIGAAGLGLLWIRRTFML